MPGTFKCKQCNRTFSMAAHLGRHMNTIHGAKKPGGKRGPARAKRSSGKKSRGMGRVVSASAVGDDGARVMSQMAAYHDHLVSQRESIDAKIDAVAVAMQTLGSPSARSSAGGRSAGRRPAARPVSRGKANSGARPGSLKDFIVRVLGSHSRPMSPNDIGTSVKKAGFKTKAKDLTKAVSNVLPTIKKVKRVGFGQYQLN